MLGFGRKPIEEPYFFFDDQLVYLRANGEISDEAIFNSAHIAPISHFDLDPAAVDTGEIKEHLQKALTYSQDRCEVRAERLGEVINYNIAPRAKMLWLLNKAMHYVSAVQTSVYTVGVDAAMTNNALQQDFIGHLVWSLFRCNAPSEFLDYVKNRDFKDAPDMAEIVKFFLKNLDEMHSPEADEFARREAKLWLSQQGFATPITGSGETLFNDNDKVALAKTIADAAQKRLDNIDGLIEELRAHVKNKGKSFQISDENAALTDEVLELPKNTRKELAVLFDLALQDETLSIGFFSGKIANKMKPTYGEGFQLGQYQYADHRVFIPKYDIEKIYLTLKDSYPIQGAFSVLNELSILTNEEKAPKSEVWKEELLHRALARIFENGCLPYSSSDGDLGRKYLKALDADLKNKELKDTLATYNAEYNIPAEKDLPPSPSEMNKLLIASQETIVKVIRIIDAKGWDEAARIAPNLTQYVQEEILPRAHAKTKECGIRLTYPKTASARLQSKPIPYKGAPPTGSGDTLPGH